MDAQHLDYDDESLVRAALQAAYPHERSVFSQRRGQQIVRAAAVEELERGRPFLPSRVAACVAAAFTLFAGTAGAAGASLPGQPLYPLKQAVERAMVAVTTDEVAAARLELRFAGRRLDEASAVEAGDVTSRLNQRFDEHINAATALAGNEVAGEVEELQRSQDQHDTNSVAVPAPPAPVQEPPPAEVDEPSVEPSPQPTSSPSPSPSASPSPSESISPSPSPSPSPAPSDGMGSEPATRRPLDNLRRRPIDDLRTSAD